jgi:hypothetical protein
MTAARTLINQEVTDRGFYLFDTFEGIPAPGENDAFFGGDHEALMGWWERSNSPDAAEPWLNAPVEEVVGNMADWLPDAPRAPVPGLAGDTVPAHAPEQIAFLRLDTDYYASTTVELELMLFRVAPGGIVIIDDTAIGRHQEGRGRVPGNPFGALVLQPDRYLWSVDRQALQSAGA